MFRPPFHSLIYGHVDLGKRHQSMLRKMCGRHVDLFDRFLNCFSEILQKYDNPTNFQKAIADWREQLRSELAARGATNQEYVNLQIICWCVLFGSEVNRQFSDILRWTDLPLIRTDTFFIALTPKPELDVAIEQASRFQWVIEMTFGFRWIVAEATLLCLESVSGRGKADFSSHFTSNIRRIVEGTSPVPYSATTLQQVGESGILAYLAKMFVFSH
jgi:hypothetical protein